MINMPPIPISPILDGNCDGKHVDVRGWIYRKRESKDVIFLVIRDNSGIIQCPVKKGSPAWKEAERITIESSASISGIVKKDSRAPGGFEILTDQLTIIGLAETFPITK